MIVWTVANQKGGVGKTTTVISLAGLLAERGHRVLLIDTDPHASLTSYLGYDSDLIDGTLYELFQTPSPSREAVLRYTLKTPFEGLDIIPANMALATLDRVLGNREGMGLFLKRALDQVKNDYDYVLIDCPPVLGVMMVNALAACSRILVPVQTEFLALKGLERMIRTFNIMQRSRPKPFKYCVIPTMFDKRTKASLSTLQAIKDKHPTDAWNSVIPIDTKFRDASLKHIPPSAYSRNCRGVFAYETLLNHLQQLENKEQAK
ncbi:ParA family protein [Motilimonas sp. KMU-193]|uniref:ParA family protein n=1 Tax=Motilimonas sp. KMU-193 TaxID=3388668 RepID=UPI00396B0097